MRIVIADDDHFVRTGLQVLLRAQPDLEVVGTAEDGQQLLRLVDEVDPDVALIDIRMPKLDGIAATRTLVERDRSRPRVLILTTFGHEAYVDEAIAAGAGGFVLKRAQPEHLYHAIRLVGGGECLVLPAGPHRGPALRPVRQPTAVPEAPTASPWSGAAPQPSLTDLLTVREAEVLRLIATGSSNSEIAEELRIRLHTVKGHVASILGKIGVRDRTQAVVAAYQLDFMRQTSRYHQEGT